MSIAIDNDVVLKGACYDLLTEFVHSTKNKAVFVLGAAPFVLRSAVSKMALRGRHAPVLHRLAQFFEKVESAEPTEGELKLAADLEYFAQRGFLQLDPGESQLCAITIERKIPLLVTGDKRAVAALEAIIDLDPRFQFLANRILCLEQLVARVLKVRGVVSVRRKICAEPDVDKALTICFSCASARAPEGSCEEGLRSYIRTLRGLGGRVLMVQ